MDKNIVDNLENPFFSIITVVKNAEDSIQKCIDSIEMQSFKNYEYIVIDGNSSDGTLDILALNSNKIDKFISENDQGLYFAMNKGLNLARGRYVGILNADDSYCDSALEQVYNTIIAEPSIEIVYGGIIDLGEGSREFYIDAQDLSKTMIFHPTCFVSRSLYSRIGLFDTKYKVAADYEFMTRAKRLGAKFKGIKGPIVFFSPGGYSSKQRYVSICETLAIQSEANGFSLFRKCTKFTRLILGTYILNRANRNLCN